MIPRATRRFGRAPQAPRVSEGEVHHGGAKETRRRMSLDEKREKFNEFLQTPGGKTTAVAICLAALAILYLVSRNHSPAEDAANNRTYICSETGKSFKVALKAGMGIPIHSPYSGKDTGYPAEACYWNKDGTPKAEPTWVLLNETVGKPGPTFCPDCGRLVRGHNPAPEPGRNPPPTAAEYKPGRRGDTAQADR